MSLLTDTTKISRMHLLETETFKDTFGPKRIRKRPKLISQSVNELAVTADVLAEKYELTKDSSLLSNILTAEKPLVKEWYERSGQSRRIWNELYKVFEFYFSNLNYFPFSITFLFHFFHIFRSLIHLM